MSLLKEDLENLSEQLNGLKSQLETISLTTNHFHEDILKDIKRLESYVKDRELETKESLSELRKRTHELRNDFFSMPIQMEKNISERIGLFSDKILAIEKEQERAKSVQEGKSHFSTKVTQVLFFVIPVFLTGAGYIYTQSIKNIVDQGINNAVDTLKQEIKTEIDFEHNKHSKEYL